MGGLLLPLSSRHPSDPLCCLAATGALSMGSSSDKGQVLSFFWEQGLLKHWFEIFFFWKRKVIPKNQTLFTIWNLTMEISKKQSSDLVFHISHWPTQNKRSSTKQDWLMVLWADALAHIYTLCTSAPFSSFSGTCLFFPPSFPFLEGNVSNLTGRSWEKCLNMDFDEEKKMLFLLQW